MNRHKVDSELCIHGSFNHFYGAFFQGFDLPCSESVFGISQDPSMYAHAPLSQDRVHWSLMGS